MTILFAGLDRLILLRQAGGSRDPDPVIAAALAELAGAGGVSLSVGSGRNDMQERDLRLLRETAGVPLNVCLPPVDEAVKLVLSVRPDLATLTLGASEGVSPERGLDVEDRGSELVPIIEALRAGGVAVSVLVDPAPAQVKAAHRAGTAAVLLHTGRYSWAGDQESRATELERLVNAAKIGHRFGLAVHAGGGLGYQNAGLVAGIPEIEAVHVGHGLVARATLVGMGEAVRELLRALQPDAGRR